MIIEPPNHLSEGAAAYLRDPDVLEYPTDWTDPWAVHEVRETAHALWCAENASLDFDYAVTHDLIAGVPVERITVGQPSSDAAILHLHGGFYCLGTPEIDRVLNAPLARATGMEIISVDYRLAPEHVFPAAVDDAVSVLAELTTTTRSVVIAGESAGGGLAAACTIAARDRGLRMPAGLVLISAMLDLTGMSDTYRTLAAADPDYGDTRVLLDPGRAYAGSTPLDHPLVSPVYADLHDLPPTLIHIGNRELLLGDSTRFAQKARRQGIAVDLHVLDGGWHNSPIWYGVPEADDAVADISAFIRKVIR